MNTPTFSFPKIIFLIIYFMLYIPFFIRIISHKPLEFGLLSHTLILSSYLAITILNYKKNNNNKWTDCRMYKGAFCVCISKNKEKTPI
ncbi:hypothetical protein CDB3_27205 [Bacillus sp. CDB3]|nr:hypothetical protein CDB3_27205 [Bacillus sp. CDB3]